MAEAQHEAFDEAAWSKTMEPEEHVKTYGSFIELVKIGALGTLAVMFALMIFAFGQGVFYTVSAFFIFLFALFTSIMGISRANVGAGPALAVTIVGFVLWLFAVL